jgi:hypothetical protein
MQQQAVMQQGSMACAQCPRGSYCADGLKASPCGGNCTTVAGGGDSALQCVGIGSSYSITYFFAPSAAAVSKTLTWPPYVATRSCTLYSGKFSCIVTMPSCVADAILNMWMAHLDVAADAKALNITAFRGNPKIEMITLQSSRNSYKEPFVVPPFVVEPRQWGQTRLQYFSTLLVLSSTLAAMAVMAAWMFIIVFF